MQALRSLARPVCAQAARAAPSSGPRSSHLLCTSTTPTTNRLFSTILTSTSSPLRPTLASPCARAITSTPSTINTQIIAAPVTQSITSVRMFSASAPLGGPRNTYFATHRVRKRRHGFLSRIKTRTGRMTLKRRRAKGRQNMSH